MSKLNIIDDLIAPSDRLKVKYKGPNPIALMDIVPGMIKDIMKIPGKDLLETDIRWDATDGGFYGVWMGKRTEDRWSTTFLRVIVQGVQGKDETGWFVVEIKGTLETGYQFSNFIQRSFWWVYNHGFYYRQRRQYLEQGKDDIFEMRDLVLNRFKIAQEE